MSATPAQSISAQAHEALPHANPLTVAQMEALIERAARGNPGTVLEIGCGPGSFAIGVATLCEAYVTALDTNLLFLTRARRAAAHRALRGTLTFELRPAAEHDGRLSEVVACLGASQAFGTPREALRRVAALVPPGGRVLFAELTWVAPPPPSFLEFLGVEASFYWSPEEAAEIFDDAGLALEEEWHASRAAWDDYETAVRDGRLACAATLPPNEADTLRARAEDWFRRYETEGRHCLGFTAWSAVRGPAPPARSAGGARTV